MKQVTMESVKQRIADLESAGKVVGGLSLSSEFELACLRELVAVTSQRDALVVENVALRNFCKNASFDADYEAELGMEYGGFTDALNAIKTPATDAAIASLRAEWVDIARNALIAFVEGDVGPNENVPGLIRGAELCVSIARQLRESKGEVSNG